MKSLKYEFSEKVIDFKVNLLIFAPSNNKNQNPIIGQAIFCYDCHSDHGTCNDGKCDGIVCIKMETSNKDNGSLF